MKNYIKKYDNQILQNHLQETNVKSSLKQTNKQKIMLFLTKSKKSKRMIKISHQKQRN